MNWLQMPWKIKIKTLTEVLWKCLPVWSKWDTNLKYI